MSNFDDPTRSTASDPGIFPPDSDEGAVTDIGRNPGGSSTAAPEAPDEKADKAFKSIGPIPSVIVGFILALAVIIFLAQNTNKVQVSFLGWDGNVALAIVVLVVAFAAVLVDEIAGVLIRRKYRRVKNERAELKRLRNR